MGPFLSTKSHGNCFEISLNARGYNGILYFKKLGGGPVQKITLYVSLLKSGANHVENELCKKLKLKKKKLWCFFSELALDL